MLKVNTMRHNTEAQHLWELALRLNPNQKKAKIALHKLKDFLRE
jgi:hypothetical protein